jgi:serine/threonine-protein kinase RsbW
VPDLLELALSAEPSAPSRVRRAVTDWLFPFCGRQPLCEAAEDLVYAVSEAVSNSVDHAYAGSRRGGVTVRGRFRPTGRGPVGCSTGVRVELVVVDTGRWREPREVPEGRGRGLRMIGAFVDAVEVSQDGDGTTVTLRRLLDCPAG